MMANPRLPLPLASPKEQRLTDEVIRFFADSGQASLLELTRKPEDPQRAAALAMQAANTVLDEEGRQLTIFFEQQNTPVVCHSGCLSCCCQLVRCTIFDAMLIKLYLAEHQDVRTCFESAYAQWDMATASFRSGYLRWAERWREGVDDGSYRFQDYFVRCPFLNDENRCSIYPVRPYCCRSCIAVDAACHSPTVPGDVPGMRNILYGNIAHKAVRDILTTSLWRCFGMKPQRVAFIPMVELVRHLLHEDVPTTVSWMSRL